VDCGKSEEEIKPRKTAQCPAARLFFYMITFSLGLQRWIWGLR